MTTWNHRVVKMDDEDGTLRLAEVFYDEGGKAFLYTEPFMCSETVEGLQELLTRLTEALKEPVLDATSIRRDDG